jgi:predicted RNA-binding protein associated with RNAse of E/G family
MEEVDISGDEILFLDDNKMVTRWDPIHPRDDFAKGYSCTYLKEGYKISKVMNSAKEVKYWYCDIISVEIKDGGNLYRLVDLLLDVKIMPNGQVIVMDMDELALAAEKKLITQAMAIQSLRQCDRLLKRLYSGELLPEVEKTFREYCE